MICLWNRSCDSSTGDLISNLFFVAVSSSSCCHFFVFSKILACDFTIGNSSADKFDRDPASNLAHDSVGGIWNQSCADQAPNFVLRPICDCFIADWEPVYAYL